MEDIIILISVNYTHR